MWKLIYEDTFNFGEDRDPPAVECSGENDEDGFYRLWEFVLNESLVETTKGPVTGFARFTLKLCDGEGLFFYIHLNTDKELNVLSDIKHSCTADDIKIISSEHYRAYIEKREEQFWLELKSRRLR